VVVGSPATLTEATSGGVWSSSHTSIISLSGSTGLSVTAIALTSGNAVISYSVTGINGCTGVASETITATLTQPHTEGVTAPSLSKGEEVLLYPNPTNGIINIKASTVGIFYVYSLDGKSVGAFNIAEGITTVSLPDALATGIYMGKYMSIDGNIQLFKVVKE
jgi:hypothetical protein